LIEAENEAAWLGLALQEARGPNVFLLRCGRIPEAGLSRKRVIFWRVTARINRARRICMPARKLHRTDISVSRAGRRTHRLPRSHAGRAARRLSKARGLCCSRDHIFYARTPHRLTGFAQQADQDPYSPKSAVLFFSLNGDRSFAALNRLCFNMAARLMGKLPFAVSV